MPEKPVSTHGSSVDDSAERQQLRIRFLETMRLVPQSVAVVVSGPVSQRIALTVGTFISVSADPPMVLTSVKRSNPICEAAITSRRFSVNILAAEQTDQSDRFSGRPSDGTIAYDMSAAQWAHDSDERYDYLEGAIACFGCELAIAEPVASHVLLIGQVRDLRVRAGPPLLYWSQTYATLRSLAGNGI